MAKNSPGEFIRQVRAETAKVVWPTRKETTQTAIMVLIMTIILAFFFLGVDAVFNGIVQALLSFASGKLKDSIMARWYIIHAYSGFENKVRDQILAEAERKGLTPLVEAVEVPTEQVTEVRRGKKVKAERKFFPGYVLAKLNMNDDVYHLVKNTPKVTGFLGANNKPQPISEAEASRILNTKEQLEAAPKKRVTVDYEIGDQVKVLGGPFASFNGAVEELDFDKNRVKVSVSIFGRATPVELDFEEVELMK
jgi:transcription termination/antitermination protein NusG